MNQFYLTLPSNSSMEVFKQNTQSHYIVRLPEEIRLDDAGWHCGLSEIHCPVNVQTIDSSNDSFELITQKSPQEEEKQVILLPDKSFFSIQELIEFLNIDLFHRTHETLVNVFAYDEHTNTLSINTGKEYAIEITNNEPDSLAAVLGMKFIAEKRFNILNKLRPELRNVYKFSPPKNSYNLIQMKNINQPDFHRALFKIDRGFYKSFTEIFAAINYVLPKELKNSLEFRERTDKTISVRIKKKGIEIQLSEALSEMFGFEHVQIKDYYRGKYPSDLTRGGKSVFVYTNIIQPEIVGDTYARLLKVFQLEPSKENKEMMIYTCNRIDYKPLQLTNFETVEILIANDSGEEIKFNWGKVIVVLHFRRFSF